MKTAIKRSARATAQLAGGLRTAAPALASLIALPFLVLALPFAPGAVRPWHALTRLERTRAGRLTGHPIPEPRRATADGRWARFRASITDPASRRGALWVSGQGVCGGLSGVIAVGLWPGIVSSATIPLYWWLLPPGSVTAFVEVRNWTQALTLAPLQTVLYVALLLWGVPWAARVQLRAAEKLLGPSRHTVLAREVERLTETRTEALVSHGAELRRIERDLHDGVQAQLVAVSVRLGLAERALRAQGTQAEELLRDARAGIEDSLGTLRDVVRGIYPPILSDRGLTGAVHALAGGQRVPVSVRVPGDFPRPPAPIEAAAYFVIAESLTNVSKHSTASKAEVELTGDGRSLRIFVRDDGQGGADQTTGSGLSGILRRVAALDGSARVESPAGRGTTIEVTLPCG